MNGPLNSRPIIAVIQARMTSTRLPGKVLATICGTSLLELLVSRLSRAALLDGIIVATSENAADDPIADLSAALGLACHRGSENDVLSRFDGAAAQAEACTVVRITGDCPLIDAEIVDQSINGADYASNTLIRTYPIGMDTEVFKVSALRDAARRGDGPEEREHVTPYLYRNPDRFVLHSVAAPESLRAPELRLTVDTAEDLELVTKIFEALLPSNPAFGLEDILQLLRIHPDWLQINRHVPHRWLAAT